MIVQKLQADQLAALKAGQKDRLEVLRYILAQIKNKEIEKQDELTDEEAVALLQKIAKELKESADAARSAGRPELLQSDEKQLKVISEYLPKELSDGELTAEIDRLIRQNQEIIAKNPKAIIGVVMKSLRTKADPSRIMPILQEKLK